MSDETEEIELNLKAWTAPGYRKQQMLERWDMIYRMWEQGLTFEEIGSSIDRSPSTAVRLLKRAAIERQKQPGFEWPKDDMGRKICDIAHPMPKNENPKLWAHARCRSLLKRDGSHRDKVGYCPVCQQGGLISRPVKGKPLIEILT